MDTLPPQLLIFVLGVILLLGFLTALAKTASIEISDNMLAELAQENKKAKRLWNILENQPSNAIGSMEMIGDLFGFLFGIIAVLSFWNDTELLLYKTGIENRALLHILNLVIYAALIEFLYLVFWNMLPKNIGGKYAQKLAVSMSGYTAFISAVGKPFLRIAVKVSELLARVFGVNPEDLQEEVTEEEIRMMVDIGSEKGTIDDDEKEMIHNIFEMDDKIYLKY